MKAYLDNNVVSAIARNDTPTETDAIDRLLAAYEQGKVDLGTSELTLVEIKAYAGPMRPQIERIYRLLKKVPVVSWSNPLFLNVLHNRSSNINSPMFETDPSAR